MATISQRFTVGQVRVGEEFYTFVGEDGPRRQVRVRVVAVRSVMRGTDEADLEVLDPA